ncbi:hypothetical protein H2199_002950 [Coniosporium tulheliwenetii]|uniref:Uncharacterized protein n=1 Tax=Coniosporium tulheliwenetii TaxID=3383036 RepID=A0ACC2ZFY7_9PEZI|nr:hypothetical protein H2199_002950 [Cladosporium sp. JES 115]
MRLNLCTWSTILAASGLLLGISGSPLDRRQSRYFACPRQLQQVLTENSYEYGNFLAPTAALVETTISGKATTIEVAAPTSSKAATSTTADSDRTVIASSTTSSATYSSTAAPLDPSEHPLQCMDENAKPFCLPHNHQDVYVGSKYYGKPGPAPFQRRDTAHEALLVTWNRKYFAEHANITIILNYANETAVQAWSSPPTDNLKGLLTVDMDKAWLKGYSRNNLTFFLTADGKTYDGPEVSLQHEPPRHAPNQSTGGKIDKTGLMIGLPVALGFVLFVVVGLWFGMRKTRRIGLGSVMGRGKHGYGSRKSRRQRMDLRKKSDVLLQERELGAREPAYRDEAPPRPNFAQGHARDASLGSLVSQDEEPRNHFRSEVERQRTGR